MDRARLMLAGQDALVSGRFFKGIGISSMTRLTADEFFSVSRLTRRASAAGAQSIFGQSASFGGTSFAGPLPSSVKCTCRVAAQFGIMATG